MLALQHTKQLKVEAGDFGYIEKQLRYTDSASDKTESCVEEIALKPERW